MKTRKRLPLNVQTFEKMIRADYLYVDKTEHIFRLITQEGSYVFLSRPRLFGKSLLVSTLKEVFSGNRELFEGLAIYEKLNWATYPVIHLDLLQLDSTTPEHLTHDLIDRLDRINHERQLQIQPVGGRRNMGLNMP